jgi:hypothetical protein
MLDYWQWPACNFQDVSFNVATDDKCRDVVVTMRAAEHRNSRAEHRNSRAEHRSSRALQ